MLHQWVRKYVTVLVTALLLGVVEAKFGSIEKQTLNVGAVFPPGTVAEVAFLSALNRHNMNSKNKYSFNAIIEHAQYGDSFAASRAACRLMKEGVIAVYGPTDPTSASAVEAQCRSANIPHIQATWRPPRVRGLPQPSPPGINLYPEAVTLSKALAFFIKDNDWTSYTLLYDDDQGLIRLQEILKHANPEHKWIVKRLTPGGDNRPLLKSLKLLGETKIILDCATERVIDYLREAQEVEFFEDYMEYLLTSIDAQTLDLESVRVDLAANVTCLKIINSEDSVLAATSLADWGSHQIEGIDNTIIPKSTRKITVEAALAADAAKLIAETVELPHEDFILDELVVECGQGGNWTQGPQFVEQILNNKRDLENGVQGVKGITGLLALDSTSGERKVFDVDIMELSNGGFNKIAQWNITGGFTYTQTADEKENELLKNWQNKIFRVVTRIGAPYLIERKPEEGQELTGNDRYEGYSKDLIHEVLKVSLGLTYELVIVPGNGYGSFNKETKKWDGLVGYLLERKADLAICDLTITYERRSYVDFTTPFMTLGISILYTKPLPPEPELFSFLKPFSVDVWIYMAGAYLLISLLLHVLARLCPNDWENPHPCDKSPEELENIWHIKNSCWLTMGSIMTQGSDILPKGYSTRWVAGMWWFFALIMCSSYTANLAAFLTNAAMDDSIKSADDLAMQTKIKYGTVKGGSTSSFFKRSNHSTYQKMWAAMDSARPSVFLKNNDEGVERVLKSKRSYAFLMESTAIEYQLERHCDLMQVGGLLDSKGYGIAMNFGAPFRTVVDNAVLKLAESGVLMELKNRWWKVKEGEGGCAAEAGEDANAGELGVDNVGGVFVVLGIGCGMAACLGALEFLWHIKDVAVEQKMTQSEAFWAELIFALSFWETEKPVEHDKSKSSSASDSNPGSRASSVLRSAADLFRLDVFK